MEQTRSKPFDSKNYSTTNNINNNDDEEEIDDHSTHVVELNNRIKNDFMEYCLSFLQEDEEARECVQVVWNKYLQCVGDISMVNQNRKVKIIFLHFFYLDIGFFRYTFIQYKNICISKISK